MGQLGGLDGLPRRLYRSPVDRLRVANGALPNTDLGSLSATVHACEKRIAAGAPDEIALTAHLHTLRDACLLQMRRLQQSAVRGRVVVFTPGPADDMVPNLLGQSITGDLARAGTTSLFEGGYEPRTGRYRRRCSQTSVVKRNRFLATKLRAISGSQYRRMTLEARCPFEERTWLLSVSRRFIGRFREGHPPRCKHAARSG